MNITAAMNSRMFVPVTTLIKEPSIAKHSPTCADIVMAAHLSNHLLMDESNKMIRPNIKTRRNILILREIPEVTCESDIRNIIETCPYLCGTHTHTNEVNLFNLFILV
eukprot:GHVR01149170.1.p1 GENE.GHVR01149170.1~~GHVR01149170.1.p1  ORF type:complete len:108 (+),score=10.35 GHVR01149170.1:164-487(+)